MTAAADGQRILLYRPAAGLNDTLCQIELACRHGERFGRNARYASLGNGGAAALMGTCGYLLSSRSVFLVTFLLAIPTLLALSRIREREIDPAQAHGAVAREEPDASATSVLELMRLIGKKKPPPENPTTDPKTDSTATKQDTTSPA